MIPAFAVVGHPNKGKSSIVATLAHNDSIQILPTSGTTQHSQYFTVTIDNQDCYSLIDTPGFQRPRQVLHWLKQSCSDASGRRQSLQAFVDAHQDNQQFDDEVQLLRPILQGACIIYVVDGSRPYQADYEAEMEILQWSGEPRMALINPIAGDTWVAQWQQALGQYFSLVQRFDPMLADRRQQIQMLDAFAVLKPEWHSVLTRARDAIKSELDYRHRRSGELLVAYMKDALCLKMQQSFDQNNSREAQSKVLKKRYFEGLKGMEKDYFLQIESLYQHRRLQSDYHTLKLESHNLFDRESWHLWGLERKKIVAMASGGGALAGAVIDAGVGGSSLMLGAAAGATLSGVASWLWGKELARVKIHGLLPLGKRLLQTGPISNPELAWVIFGRAVYHLRAIRQRSHARRDVLIMTADQQAVMDVFSDREKMKISRWLLSGKEKKMQRLQEDIIPLINERL